MSTTGKALGIHEPPHSQWPGKYAEEYTITRPSRSRVHAYPDLDASLRALDRFMDGQDRVVIAAPTGAAPRRAQLRHYFSGWLALSAQELLRHVIVLGSSGSGKTTRVLYPLMYQVLKRFPGSSVFAVCIKDEAVTEFTSIASRCSNGTHKVVAPGHHSWNLIAGLTPSQAADLTSDVYQGKDDTAKYFADHARRRCLHALNIIAAIGEPYNLYSVYKFCFQPEYGKLCVSTAKERIRSLNGNERLTLEESLNFCENEWTRMDPRARDSIKNTLARAIAVFADPSIRACFAGDSGIDIDSAVATRCSVAVHVPVQHRSEADAIYAMAKRRFSEAVFKRPVDKRHRLILALFDEAQNYLSENDSYLLDKARQYGCAMCLGTNTYSALISQFSSSSLALKIFENCATKIIFDTNHALLQELQTIAGKVRILKKSESTERGNSQNHSILTLLSAQQSSNNSGSRSRNEDYIEYIDGELFREKHDGQALIITVAQSRFIIDIVELPVVRPMRDGRVQRKMPAWPAWVPCPSVDFSSSVSNKLWRFWLKQP